MRQIMILFLILVLCVSAIAVGEGMTKEDIADEFGISTIYDAVARQNVYIDQISKEHLIALLNNDVTLSTTFGSDIGWARAKVEELGLVAEGYKSSKIVKEYNPGADTSGATAGSGPADTSEMKTKATVRMEKGYSEPSNAERMANYPSRTPSESYFSINVGGGDVTWKFISLLLAVALVVMYVHGNKK